MKGGGKKYIFFTGDKKLADTCHMNHFHTALSRAQHIAAKLINYVSAEGGGGPQNGVLLGGDKFCCDGKVLRIMKFLVRDHCRHDVRQDRAPFSAQILYMSKQSWLEQ